MKRLAFLLLLLAACTGDPAPVTTPPAWRAVLEHQPGALLSVWGTSATDVWSVGGSLGDPGGADVVHFDGATWTPRAAGGTASFWWVHGVAGDDVWLVGEKGRITHWDRAFHELASGTTATLFGVFASSAADVWAVGGTPESPAAPNDVVLHWDGSTWSPVTLPTTLKVAFYKVWGIDDQLWIVGENGIVWHRRAGAWQREAEGLATGRLTTVTGCSASEVYAVGGRDVLTFDGTAWSRAPVDSLLINDVNGVACRDGHVLVVGGGSLKLRREAGAWTSDFGTAPLADLHGAWIDPSGGMWGAGGNFTGSGGGSREGVIGRRE